MTAPTVASTAGRQALRPSAECAGHVCAGHVPTPHGVPGLVASDAANAAASASDGKRICGVGFSTPGEAWKGVHDGRNASGLSAELGAVDAESAAVHHPGTEAPDRDWYPRTPAPRGVSCLHVRTQVFLVISLRLSLPRYLPNTCRTFALAASPSLPRAT